MMPLPNSTNRSASATVSSAASSENAAVVLARPEKLESEYC
jgi:hypothetical protein